MRNITKNLMCKGTEYYVKIWNNPGQKRFRVLSETYIKLCDIIISEYDITSIDAYKELKKYNIRQDLGHLKKKNYRCIVGNKADL